MSFDERYYPLTDSSTIFPEDKEGQQAPPEVESNREDRTVTIVLNKEEISHTTICLMRDLLRTNNWYVGEKGKRKKLDTSLKEMLFDMSRVRLMDSTTKGLFGFFDNIANGRMVYLKSTVLLQEPPADIKKTRWFKEFFSPYKPPEEDATDSSNLFYFSNDKPNL